MEVKIDEPGPSSGLLPPDDEIRVVAVHSPPPPEGHSPFDRLQVIDIGLYNAWRAHFYTFVIWLILSLAAVILIPFSDTLDADEAILVSLGAWMGVIACALYFLPIPVKHHPRRIKRLAFLITVFSIFAFVMDFPTAVGCIWSIRGEQDEVNSEDDDVVLGVSAGGCFSIVAFAKCMIIGTYEIPVQLFKPPAPANRRRKRSSHV